MRVFEIRSIKVYKIFLEERATDSLRAQNKKQDENFGGIYEEIC